MTNPDDWDRHWRDYADTAEQNPAQNYRREIILSLLDITGAGEDSRIIDIGSGQGDMAAAIRARISDIENTGTAGKLKAFCVRPGIGLSLRSEERRVGKECRSRWSPYH